MSLMIYLLIIKLFILGQNLVVIPLIATHRFSIAKKIKENKFMEHKSVVRQFKASLLKTLESEQLLKPILLLGSITAFFTVILIHCTLLLMFK